MTFLDTNVLIDVFQAQPEWVGWSRRQLGRSVASGKTYVDPVVIGELAAGFPDLDTLRRELAAFPIEIAPIDENIAFVAGRRFAAYRKDKDDRVSLLSDFLIGAHALALGSRLLTRDPKIYKRYFPDLTLITPETDHG